MKKQELELLIHAGDVESMVISRSWSNADQDTAAHAMPWEVWAYGGNATSSRGNAVSTARGERRLFRTLDTAYTFIRDCGFRGSVEVEERFLPVNA